MSENTPEYTIAEHYDPDREMSPNADPLSAYLTYVADVRGGAVGEMRFSLQDFKQYTDYPETTDRKKITLDNHPHDENTPLFAGALRILGHKASLVSTYCVLHR
jgi:hypothetical protein